MSDFNRVWRNVFLIKIIQFTSFCLKLQDQYAPYSKKMVWKKRHLVFVVPHSHLSNNYDKYLKFRIFKKPIMKQILHWTIIVCHKYLLKSFEVTISKSGENFYLNMVYLKILALTGSESTITGSFQRINFQLKITV